MLQMRGGAVGMRREDRRMVDNTDALRWPRVREFVAEHLVHQLARSRVCLAAPLHACSRHDNAVAGSESVVCVVHCSRGCVMAIRMVGMESS